MKHTIKKYYIKKSPETLCPRDIEKFLCRRRNTSWFSLPPRMESIKPRMVSPLVPRQPSDMIITTILSK
jgi:hypothetical protein